MTSATRYRRRALLASTLAFASTSALLLGVPVLAPELRGRFDLSVPEVGIMLACPEIGIVLTLLGWGEAADRLGERITLIAGLVGAALATIAAAGSPTTAVFFLALAIAGACGAAVLTSSPRMVLGLFPSSQQGMALAIRYMAIPGSGACVALALAPIAKAGGTQLGLLLLGIAMFVSAIVAMRSLDPNRHPPTFLSNVSRPHPVRDMRVLRICVAGGILIAGQVIVVGFATLYLVDAQGLSTATASMVFAGMLIIAAVLLPVVSWWSDRREERFRPLAYVSFGLAIGFGLIAVLDATPVWTNMAVLILTGALAFSGLPLLTAALGKLVPRSRHGAAMGLQQLIVAASAALSPIVFGWGVETFSWGTSYAGTGALMLILAAWMTRIEEPHSNRGHSVEFRDSQAGRRWDAMHRHVANPDCCLNRTRSTATG